MISTPIAQPATPDTTAVDSDELLIPTAIDVRKLSKYPVNILFLKDFKIDQFEEGKPCPIKLVDGIFLNGDNGVERIDTFTFKLGLNDERNEHGNYLRPKLLRTQSGFKSNKDIVKLITKTLALSIDKIGDYTVEEAAKKGVGQRDKKPETLLESMTVSDAQVVMYALRAHLYKEAPFVYSVNGNCDCQENAKLVDIEERDSNTDEDVTELHDIKGLSIRYFANADNWKELPLYGVKLPKPFYIPAAVDNEPIDELYFSPMLIRDLEELFDAGGGGKGKIAQIPVAKSLASRVVRMPQCPAVDDRGRGNVFSVGFYDHLANKSAIVVQRALKRLEEGEYFGVPITPKIEFRCFAKNCPFVGGKTVSFNVNWLVTTDFLFDSVEPRE